jgi:hypothetical protein
MRSECALCANIVLQAEILPSRSPNVDLVRGGRDPEKVNITRLDWARPQKTWFNSQAGMHSGIFSECKQAVTTGQAFTEHTNIYS